MKVKLYGCVYDTFYTSDMKYCRECIFFFCMVTVGNSSTKLVNFLDYSRNLLFLVVSLVS